MPPRTALIIVDAESYDAIHGTDYFKDSEDGADH